MFAPLATFDCLTVAGMKYLVMYLFTLSPFVTGSACEAQIYVEHNNQQWIQYYHQASLGRSLILTGDAGLRWRNGWSEMSQMLIRGGLLYQAPHLVRMGGGFACFTALSAGEISRIELRPYQEISVTDSLGKVQMQQRLRAEERIFFPPGNSGDVTWNFRFRYRFYTTVRLLSFNQKAKAPALQFHAGDEVFINAGKHIVYNVLDNNRLLAGISVNWNAHWETGLIYNWQFGQRLNAGAYEDSDVFWLTVTHRTGK